MNSLINQIVSEHQHLVSLGRVPDSLFLNASTRKELYRQALAVYSVKEPFEEFLGMTIYLSEQRRDNQFRIYCKPQYTGEF
jgi:hypothetical protein